MNHSSMEQVLKEVVAQFRCDINSIHGVKHWLRVRENGIKIAAVTPGADIEVVCLFSVLHDSQRVSDYGDRLHGTRASAYAIAQRGTLFTLDNRRFPLLISALAYHADGHTAKDPTIGACWDADRLDLPRVGITPDPDRMSTAEGRRLAKAMLPVF